MAATGSSLLDGIVQDLQDLGIVAPRIRMPDTGSAGIAGDTQQAVSQQAADPCAGLTGDDLVACRIANPDSSSGDKPPQHIKGADGNDYIWDGSKYVLAPGLPSTDSKAPVYHPPTSTRDAYYTMPDGSSTGVRVLADGTTEPDIGGSGLPYYLGNAGSAFDVTTAPESVLTPNQIDSYWAQHPRSDPGGTDNTVGLANVALRGQELAEQIKEARIKEVMAAQDAITQRIQAAQQARLEGAKFAVTPSMAQSGYFPGLAPTSPLVRSGLADPFSFRPIGFNPERVANVDDQQLQRDLAMIRGQAGYG